MTTFKLCIDPGGVPNKGAVKSTGATGWGLLSYASDEPLDLVSFGQVTGGPDAILRLFPHANSGWIEFPKSDFSYALSVASEIVIENFQKHLQSADPTPLVTIGAVRMFGQMRQVKVTTPMPGARKAVTNDHLKELGLYRREGALEHAREAVRHGVAEAIRQGHRPTILALDPDLPD